MDTITPPLSTSPPPEGWEGASQIGMLLEVWNLDPAKNQKLSFLMPLIL